MANMLKWPGWPSALYYGVYLYLGFFLAFSGNIAGVSVLLALAFGFISEQRAIQLEEANKLQSELTDLYKQQAELLLNVSKEYKKVYEEISALVVDSKPRQSSKLEN